MSMNELYCTGCGENLSCGECGQIAREVDFKVKDIEQDSAFTYLSIGLKWSIRAFIMLILYTVVIIASIVIIFPVWWLSGLFVYTIAWAYDKKGIMKAWRSTVTLTWLRNNVLRHDLYRDCSKGNKLKHDCNRGQRDHYDACSEPLDDYIAGAIIGAVVNLFITGYVVWVWVFVL